ncbi:MAG: ABC transporter permease [Aggregatilineales bacterium]
MNATTQSGQTLKINGKNRFALSGANLGLWIFVMLLMAFFAVTAPGFFTSTNAVNVLRQMAPLAIAAFGASFVIFSGGLDLSVGSVAALSGVVAAMFARDNSFAGSAEISWLVGIMVGALFGLINGSIVVYLHINPIITTLGTLAIARGIAFVLTGGVSLFGVPESFRGLGRGFILADVFPGVFSIPVVIMLILLVVCWLVLKRSVFGLYVYSIGGNEEAARLSGVPVSRIKLGVYVIGGMAAGLAGVIGASRLGSGQAASNDGLELSVITAVVLGGASISGGDGTILGTFAGVLIIQILLNGMTLLNIDPFYQRIVTGLALLIAVGLDQFRRRRARRRRGPTSTLTAPAKSAGD